MITAISDSTLDIMVADLTGNGKLDIVTAQGESGNFQNRIYINRGPSDTRPPRIIATEDLPDTDDTMGPYVVRALALDDMSSDRNFFDSGVELNYAVDGGQLQTVPMVHSGGQVYRGEIPGQAGGVIEYHVEAADFSGNVGLGDTETFVVAPLGASVTGMSLRRASCTNQTTGQRGTAKGTSGVFSWTCGDLGISTSTGDRVLLSGVGIADGAGTLSGSVVGLAFPPQRRVTCQNRTTAQTVQFSTAADSWDCEAEGLMVNQGNEVTQSVVGEI